MTQGISSLSQGNPQNSAISVGNSASAAPVLKKQQTTTPSADRVPQQTTNADGIPIDTVAVDTSKVVPAARLQNIEMGVKDHNTVATRIRQSDSALDTAISHVQALKANLAKIVKNYPPFSIDSKERMDILRSYISLRKEIDSMTIPAPPPQPGAPLKSAIWKDQGLAGLLPGELTTTASDSQVLNAHDQLGTAVQAISNGKQELQQNTLAKE